MRFLAWLKERPDYPKRAARYIRPPRIAAYWWDGGAPTAREVKDISTTGAFLCTAQRWYPGTILIVTLQEEGKDLETGSASSISLPCRVVRQNPEGVGVQFMFYKPSDREALERFVREVVVNAGERGQALVELALTAPMLCLLIALALNFGTWLYGWVAIGNAGRAAGDYAILGGASATLPLAATSSTLQSLINAELTHLPNTSSSNPTACIRQNNNGTYTTVMERPSGACTSYSNPPADPEPASYVSVAVDITYTYTSFFTGSNILGLPLSVLPSTIHRRTVMRMLQ